MKTKVVLAFILIFGLAGFKGSAKEKEGNKDKIPLGLNIGQRAPEIVEKSPDGNELRLSSLHGKVVLIDFWASWCGPCRNENPTVVKAYQEFKDAKFKDGKGFTVFSVSLDRNKGSWEQAIKADHLSWEYHVSDLQWWNSKYAIIYGVRRIPSNFLIDGNGVIVGKDLRGPALGQALKNMLK